MPGHEDGPAPPARGSSWSAIQTSLPKLNLVIAQKSLYKRSSWLTHGPTCCLIYIRENAETRTQETRTAMLSSFAVYSGRGSPGSPLRAGEGAEHHRLVRGEGAVPGRNPVVDGQHMAVDGVGWPFYQEGHDFGYLLGLADPAHRR